MANWPDAMRVISDETQDLIDAVYDLDCPTIGPFVKGVDSPDDILDFLYDHGLVVPDGADFAVLADDEDEDDDSIRGDDDEDELVAWCPGCRCERTFTVLPDSEIEGDIDPDWTYWCCPMCQCAPGDEPEPAPYVKPPVIMHDDPSWPTPRPPGEWMTRTRHRCVPSCRADPS